VRLGGEAIGGLLDVVGESAGEIVAYQFVDD
jgi:hypothetical protein